MAPGARITWVTGPHAPGGPYLEAKDGRAGPVGRFLTSQRPPGIGGRSHRRTGIHPGINPLAPSSNRTDGPGLEVPQGAEIPGASSNTTDLHTFGIIVSAYRAVNPALRLTPDPESATSPCRQAEGGPETRDEPPRGLDWQPGDNGLIHFAKQKSQPQGKGGQDNAHGCQHDQ